MTENKARQPAGVPVGGQFAATAHAEPTDVRLRGTAADEDRQDAIDNLESYVFNQLQVSDADREILGRALRREPVTAEEVDAALERNWEAEYPGPDADTYYSGIATQVFNEARGPGSLRHPLDRAHLGELRSGHPVRLQGRQSPPQRCVRNGRAQGRRR